VSWAWEECGPYPFSCPDKDYGTAIDLCYQLSKESAQKIIIPAIYECIVTGEENYGPFSRRHVSAESHTASPLLSRDQLAAYKQCIGLTPDRLTTPQ
jgi:hypothetical protein